MNCKEYRYMIEDALDTSLHGELAANVRRHLEHCADCREYFAVRRAEHAALFVGVNAAYSCLRPPPSDFADRILREVEAQRAARRGWHRFAQPQWVLIAASVAIMVGFVFAATVALDALTTKDGVGGDVSRTTMEDEIYAAVQGFSAENGNVFSLPEPDSTDGVSDAALAPETSQHLNISTTQGETKMKRVSIVGSFRKFMNNMVAVATMLLPADSVFAADDGYIESEGDAFVSLGHCAGPNTKLEVDFQLTEVTLDNKPFGSWGDRLTIPMFSLYISHAGDNVLRFSWDGTDADGNRQAHNCNIADAKRHVISFDAQNATYASTNVTDGGEVYTCNFSRAVSGYTSPYPLAVFARGGDVPATQSGHFGGATKMRVYGAKIYESGTLVKTYTPCLKGGVPGLKVTGPGIDPFVTGIDISKIKYGGDILV